MKTGYTAHEIATTLGISARAVNKRLTDDFLIGTRPNPRGSGRAMKIYKPSALNLWAKEEIFFDKKESRRNHFGKTQSGRGRNNMELINYVTAQAFKLFMQNAEGDVRACVRRAISKTYFDIEQERVRFNTDELGKLKENEWLYKQWIMRSDKFRKGVYYTEFWQKHWETTNKVHTTALSVATQKFDTYKVLENSFGAKKGYGAYRFIMLDDRSTDSWTADMDGFKMPYAIYAWDVLTAQLLHIEPVEDAVNSEHYISAILNIVYNYGCDCPVFFLENSRAAIAHNVQGTVRALYTDADLQVLNSNEYRKLMHGDIIVRNVPNIAKGFGKAKGERMFQELKRAEAYLFPRNFKGGQKGEAIELQRHNRPVLSKSYTPSRDIHFQVLWNFSQTEMLDYERDNLKKWAKEKGEKPTLQALIDYYKPETIKHPTPHQTALLIYYADRKINEVKISAIGQIRVTRDNVQHNLVAPELFMVDKKAKLQVKPVPTSLDKNGYYAEWIVYKSNGKDTLPDVVCIAKNYVATDIHESHQNALEIRQMRENYIAQFKNKVDYSHSENTVTMLNSNDAVLITDESEVIDITEQQDTVIIEHFHDEMSVEEMLRISSQF